MTKTWLPILSVGLAVFAIVNALTAKGNITATQGQFSTETLEKNFKTIDFITKHLLLRIETIEARLKIDPGKDALKVVKKEKAKANEEASKTP